MRWPRRLSHRCPRVARAHVYVDQNGKERFAVYAPVPGSTWGVLVTHPSPAAYAPNQVMVTRSIAAVAAAALVTLAVGALAAELLARPLRELRIQAEALAHGDFSPRELVQTGSSEIADLSEASAKRPGTSASKSAIWSKQGRLAPPRPGNCAT